MLCDQNVQKSFIARYFLILTIIILKCGLKLIKLGLFLFSNDNCFRVTWKEMA